MGIQTGAATTLRLEQQPEIFITYCQLCTNPIPTQRQRKSSRTCSKDCQKQYRAQRLSERKQRLKEAATRLNGHKPQKSNGNSVPKPSEIQDAL